MTTVPVYPSLEEAPEGLKTRAQLAMLGLRPGGPARGRLAPVGAERAVSLYALSEAEPNVPIAPEAPQMVSAIPHDARHAVDRAASQHWARRVLEDPRAIILDTETTGLQGFLVQVAAIDMSGNLLFNALVHPQEPIPAEATHIHHITDEMVADAPAFGGVFDDLTQLLAGKTVVVYNAPFDRGRLWEEVYRLHGSDQAAWVTADTWIASARWQCAMERWSAYVGDWNEWRGTYRWQALRGGDHTALGDCLATLKVIRNMAGGDEPS